MLCRVLTKSVLCCAINIKSGLKCNPAVSCTCAMAAFRMDFSCTSGAALTLESRLTSVHTQTEQVNPPNPVSLRNENVINWMRAWSRVAISIYT